MTVQLKSFLTRGLTPMLLAAALLSTGAVSAWAGGGDDGPKILPPQSHPYGKSYAEWSAAWWQWEYSITAPNDPITDETGQNAASNQRGPVWFLAGNLGGASERTVTVPAGKALFFPILNTAYLGFPWDPIDQGFEAANDVAGLLSMISWQMDGATLACKIDGVPIRHLPAFRTQSSAWYDVNMVDDNLWANLFGLPGGNYHPCVDDGYYLMLAPLNVGRHTIHFTGASASGFSLEVTYLLQVTPVHGQDGHGDCDRD